MRSRKCFQIFIIYLCVIICVLNIAGAQSDSTSVNTSFSLRSLDVKAYGVVNYYAFDWETLPDRRNAIDPERLNLYLYHDFTDKIEFKSEIEFEHGGTGSTLAFDALEEFGEFEQEIEKGGAVVLEQLNLLFKFRKAFNIRIGKMRFYMGNASKNDQPREYFTAYRSELENSILPLGWYETGIEISGDIPFNANATYPYASYKAYIVSGLDNTGFSSQNWIRRGYQTRFKTINADNLAYAVRLDYVFKKDSEIGVSLYAGNATGNRPKDDFTSASWVTFGDLHYSHESYPWRFKAYGMIGHVQNSEVLSTANRNLSNNLDVKRTPVGKIAGGAYVETAYDIFNLIDSREGQKCYVFGRAEWFDSMLQTEGTVSDNPRYERRILTVGLNYFPIDQIVLKMHYAWRSLGSEETDKTLSIGFGFDF